MTRGVALPVEAQHGVVIHLVDVVAGEQQHLLDVADDLEVEAHRVGGALLPRAGMSFGALVRLEQADAACGAVEIPRTAEADVLVERAGLVLRQHRDVEDAGVDAVGEREVDHAVFAREGHSGFRAQGGEHSERGPFAPGQDHREDAHRSPPSTVAPVGTTPSNRSNASSSTSASITTLRPTVMLGGMCALLPTMVGPVKNLPGSFSFGLS